MLKRASGLFAVLVVLSGVYHPASTAYASDRGSLQAQIPNIRLDEVDPQIKDACHAQAVEKSGFDPNSPDNPTKEDYQRQHFEAMGQGLVEDVLLPGRYAQWRQRERANNMRDSLKAQSDRAQGYVKAYRACLESRI